MLSETKKIFRELKLMVKSLYIKSPVYMYEYDILWADPHENLDCCISNE